MTPVTVKQAAKVMRKSPMTLRRWIKAGAPCVRLGEVGRNHGTLIIIDEMQRWRAAQVAPGLILAEQRIQLEHLAESLWRCLRSDAIAEKLGISEAQAAGALLLTYERLAKDLTRKPVDLADLPDRMKQLCSITVR